MTYSVPKQKKVPAREKKKKHITHIETIQAIIITMLLLLEGTCRIVKWLRNEERMTNNSHQDGVVSMTEINTSSELYYLRATFYFEIET